MSVGQIRAKYDSRELSKLEWPAFRVRAMAFMEEAEHHRDPETREYYGRWRLEWANLQAEARRRGEQLRLFS